MASPKFMTWGPTPQQQDPPFVCTDVLRNAWDTLNKSLSSNLVLAYSDFTRSLRLYEDASYTGLGGTLAQVQGNKESFRTLAVHKVCPKKYPNFFYKDGISDAIC